MSASHPSAPPPDSVRTNIETALSTGAELPILQHLGDPEAPSESPLEQLKARIQSAVQTLASGGQLPVLANLELGQLLENQELRQQIAVLMQQDMSQAELAEVFRATIALRIEDPSVPAAVIRDLETLQSLLVATSSLAPATTPEVPG